MPEKSMIKDFVKSLSEKAGVKTPFNLQFDIKKRVFADVSTKYHRKTGEIKSTTLRINPFHVKFLSKKDLPRTRSYVGYTIAHEIGHIKQVEEWGPRKTRSFPVFIREDDADKRAYALLGKSKESIEKDLKILRGLVK